MATTKRAPKITTTSFPKLDLPITPPFPPMEAKRVDKIPTGPIMGKVGKVVKPATGEAYVSIEAPKGELGYFIVSDNSTQPYRVRVRPPSFVNLQALDRMVRGGLVADVVAIIGTLDIVLGEVDR